VKYQEITSLLEKRILHGDYNLIPVPPERDLAKEVGVAQRTARKAMLHLEKKGLLVRLPNGRLEVKILEHQGTRKLQIAFLAPAFPATDAARWQLAIEKTVKRYDSILRPVYYVHLDDPIIQDTLDGFDGVFFLPSAIPSYENVPEKFSKSKTPVAVICGDWTRWGIPSVTLCLPEWVQYPLDYLESLGHRHIDVMNVQPMDKNVQERLEQWNIWRHTHAVIGRIINEPVEPFGWTIDKARQVMNQILDNKEFKATALLCTTEGASIGAIRAFVDHGIKVGQDVSVCQLNDEGLAKHYAPSITSIEMPNAVPYLSICMEWMKRGGKEWTGPLLVKPASVPLFKGESTGRVSAFPVR
jgi:DNA-binding LacI/PurR family transcriptional regulator